MKNKERKVSWKSQRNLAVTSDVLNLSLSRLITEYSANTFLIPLDRHVLDTIALSLPTSLRQWHDKKRSIKLQAKKPDPTWTDRRRSHCSVVANHSCTTDLEIENLPLRAFTVKRCFLHYVVLRTASVPLRSCCLYSVVQ